MRFFTNCLWVFALFMVVGCRSAAAPAGEVKPTDPDEAFREQLSKGSFALSTSANELADALQKSEAIRAKVPAGDMADDADELIDRLDYCGEAIADYTSEPPALEEFKKQLPKQREQMAKALKASIDALQSLYEAAGMVETLQDGAPKNLQTALEELADQIDAATEDLKTAVSDMGGSPPEPPEDETDDSGE